MASLRNSFQTYLGFPKNGRDNGRNCEEGIYSGYELDQKWEADDKSEEESADLWRLCEPDKSPFESLLGNNILLPDSNTRPYDSTVQISTSSGENLCGGQSDGLRLCTESLGFESSDEREDCHSDFSSISVDENQKEEASDTHYCSEAAEKGPYAPGHGHVGANRGARFPPPLPSLAGNGKASVFLKPLRKDGRFLLQEVEVPRHELLHAWRQDGRLRLQLIPRTDTSEDSLDGSDTSSTDGEFEETGVETASASGDGGQRDGQCWDASLEDEHVHVERFRGGGGVDASLPIFPNIEGLSLARCQEKATCLPTWIAT